MENFLDLFSTSKLKILLKRINSKSSKETIKKLTLSKNLVLTNVHTMLDEGIEILYDIKAVNK